MTSITPHLWYDTQAVEAATLYVSAFPGSSIDGITTLRDTPSGDCDVVSFQLAGQPFQAISAGPHFSFNPSISFLVACETADEVDALWATLGDGGAALMPLGSYPFSERYGWTTDRFGLSWQFMLTEGPAAQRISPMLLFVGEVCGKAEEAIALYTSVFGNASLDEHERWTASDQPEVEGTTKFASFRLEGRPFAAMDSALGHDFAFNEAISFLVGCEDQAEIDRTWDALSAVPEAEQCGWLKDRFGVSWQIVPAAMEGLLHGGTPEQTARVTQAFLAMKKLDLTALRRAYDGG